MAPDWMRSRSPPHTDRLAAAAAPPLPPASNGMGGSMEQPWRQRTSSQLSHTCGTAGGGTAIAAAASSAAAAPLEEAPYTYEGQMQSALLCGRGGASGHASAAAHAASNTLLRLAVDALPPHASESELKRRLGLAGLEACVVRLEVNPLSGHASGRAELTFRNVSDRCTYVHARAYACACACVKPRAARARVPHVIWLSLSGARCSGHCRPTRTP